MTGQWGTCVDVRRGPSQVAALAVAAKVCDMMEAHRMRAHPSEEITGKNGSGSGNRDSGPAGVLPGALAGESKTVGRAVDRRA